MKLERRIVLTIVRWQGQYARRLGYEPGPVRLDLVAKCEAAWQRYFGQTGGSIPGQSCPECGKSPCIGHPAAPLPPVPNKTGGPA
jgi:hypothetical protein